MFPDHTLLYPCPAPPWHLFIHPEGLARGFSGSLLRCELGSRCFRAPPLTARHDGTPALRS